MDSVGRLGWPFSPVNLFNDLSQFRCQFPLPLLLLLPAISLKMTKLTTTHLFPHYHSPDCLLDDSTVPCTCPAKQESRVLSKAVLLTWCVILGQDYTLPKTLYSYERHRNSCFLKPLPVQPESMQKMVVSGSFYKTS